MPLAHDVLSVIGEIPEVREEFGIFGYTIVGSAAYLTDDMDGGDWDVVLLSSKVLQPDDIFPRLLSLVTARIDPGRCCQNHIRHLRRQYHNVVRAGHRISLKTGS